MALNGEWLFLQVKVRRWEACRNMAIVARFTAVESAHERAVATSSLFILVCFCLGKTSLCAVTQAYATSPHSLTLATL